MNDGTNPDPFFRENYLQYLKRNREIATRVITKLHICRLLTQKPHALSTLTPLIDRLIMIEATYADGLRDAYAEFSEPEAKGQSNGDT